MCWNVWTSGIAAFLGYMIIFILWCRNRGNDRWYSISMILVVTIQTCETFLNAYDDLECNPYNRFWTHEAIRLIIALEPIGFLLGGMYQKGFYHFRYWLFFYMPVCVGVYVATYEAWDCARRTFQGYLFWGTPGAVSAPLLLANSTFFFLLLASPMIYALRPWPVALNRFVTCIFFYIISWVATDSPYSLWCFFSNYILFHDLIEPYLTNVSYHPISSI